MNPHGSGTGRQGKVIDRGDSALLPPRGAGPRNHFQGNGAESFSTRKRHVGEGDFDLLLVKALLQLPGQAIAESAVVFLQAPCAEHEVEGRIPEPGKDDQGIWLVETLHVLLGDVPEDAEDVADVFIIGNADIEVIAPDRMAGDIDDLGFHQSFIGDADRAVVESSQCEREKTDRVHGAAYSVDLDDVTKFERTLPDEEESTDDVGKRGLGCESDGYSCHPRGPQNGPQVEADLIEGQDADKREAEITDELLEHHHALRSESWCEESQGRLVEQSDGNEATNQNGSSPRHLPEPLGSEEVVEPIGQGGERKGVHGRSQLMTSMTDANARRSLERRVFPARAWATSVASVAGPSGFGA